MLEFSRIETLGGVKRTVYNQYDSLVLPLTAWLREKGVRLITDCKVVDLDHATDDDLFTVTAIHCLRHGKAEVLAVNEGDLVFVQNASMIDASSLGSMARAPTRPTKADSGGRSLWEKLARDRPAFGIHPAFNSCMAQSCWGSFTVTLENPGFFEMMTRFSGNEPGTGGLVTFTVEYSIRAAQIAVYQLLDIDREVPRITPHDKSWHTQFEALVKAFAWGFAGGKRRGCKPLRGASPAGRP